MGEKVGDSRDEGFSALEDGQGILSHVSHWYNAGLHLRAHNLRVYMWGTYCMVLSGYRSVSGIVG